ncbi:chemotaxis protein CheB [Kamptonema sp. UHCC 0994]|uniref:chemotaxis protein CheB n=1 Tax=Kamptonema sp. UHCC 0994 TaxID=3031329 RepID=UPI0023BA0C62|nr:chemotaxis protein CheB [Kamptonema sp. UHCC 0994]MDF0552230.1 chemotaxis protein CheB [Kamptonema sp. UHCC 0994]
MKNYTGELNKINFEIVVIGTSLGGLQALTTLLGDLPESFPLPVVIVQHRHKNSNNILSDYLQQQISLPVTEAEDKEAIAPGRVYLAPADYHLLIESPCYSDFSIHESNFKVAIAPVLDKAEILNRGAPTFALSTEAPVCHARPSIDVLFESAADALGEKVIGIILTGASSDGSKGLAKIKAKGGLTFVQEPDSAECRIMPAAAIAAVEVDWILPLSKIARCLVNLLTIKD